MKTGSAHASRSKWWLLADVAAIVPLLGLLAVSGYGVAYEYRILSHPMTASAVVVEKPAYQRGGDERLDLRYIFVAASGGEYSGTTGASRDFYDQTSLGDKLEIRYAADAPQYRKVLNNTEGPLSLFLAVGAAATVLFPVVLLGWLGIRSLRSDLGGRPDI